MQSALKLKASTPGVEKSAFPVDGQLLMVLPRAAASIKNPDVHLPILRSDEEGYYLEMQVEADSKETSEVAVIRRVPLENLSAEEWEELKAQYAKLDLQACTDQGISKGLEKIQDRKIQRLFMALLTFLNPRQVSIVLYLYKLAAQQGNGPIVSFRSNDLLERLGYTRTKDGGFASKLRSQLNRDLVALHRTELVLAQSLQKGNQVGAKVMIKSVLRIKDYEIDNVPRDFDLAKAADYTYELADAYTVSLEFFDGPGRTGDYVLFAGDIDISQKLGSNAKCDYKTKLLIYLASRMKWDALRDGQYLIISKQYLFKNLDLLGSNSSRNNQIFWRTVEELRQDGYILGAQELPGKKRASSIQFQVNPEKISCHY
ncbi:hypothetical protein HJG54_08660 [Leptolyngbya sp. NK1-12]|uniref:Uncharacterized protein n=1 Tax=Leptolyngbya sp. NK1-12 TaxID=2547451 RepID=A0AA97AJR4_9CYAN|nr:hypothetical protein [Leptolyngbya sp. NK1-12]WNZ22922.1 hypothetical protein HJG54_08660 [Leptolyngbya sp. NK1-12]